MTSRVLIVAALLLLTTPVDGAGSLADTVKPPPECASAKNANECADILRKLGKNPYDAFGYIGREPAYGGQNETAAPPCKSGASSCNPWERDWSNTRLPPGAIVTDEGAILPPPSRPSPWNYVFDWQTLIAGVLAFVAGFGTVVATMIIARRQIAAAREDADKVIAATREQTETAVRLERQRVSSEALAFSAMLDAAMVRVLNEVGWARKTYPQTLSQQEGASVEALFVRQCITKGGFAELRAACVRHGGPFTRDFLDLEREIDSFAMQWEDVVFQGVLRQKGKHAGLGKQLNEIGEKASALGRKIAERN